MRISDILQISWKQNMIVISNVAPPKTNTLDIGRFVEHLTFKR